MSGLAFMATVTAQGSGFALYQPSAVSHAMGGALVGKAMDASANFNNPATLSDLTNLQFTAGFVSEHPRGRVDVGQRGGYHTERSMDPGVFFIPHFQVAAPLPAGFTFGLGMGTDYGLGTQYDDIWPLNFSATDTKIQSFVINPNISYKITDDWSIGLGLRWLYFEFEQYSMPQVVQNGQNLGNFSNRLRGDNQFRDIGWQIGTKYDITDTFSVGIVYKSAINVSVDGKTSNNVRSFNDANVNKLAQGAAYQGVVQQGIANGLSPQMAQQQAMALQQSPAWEGYVSQADSVIRDTVNAQALKRTGKASADFTLPQSAAVGFNWDVTPSWHVGGVTSWTQWSQFDSLYFDLQGGGKNINLGWRDTWRTSFGACWDFAQDWKWMASYTYDMDSTCWTQDSVMLPPADRHIVATGFAWNCWGGLELALSYACIFMDGGDMQFTDTAGDTWRLETCWGFCHAAGFSVTYRF